MFISHESPGQGVSFISLGPVAQPGTSYEKVHAKRERAHHF